MKICSDVDGVILDYIRGFIEFTQKEKIPFKHNPDLWGVIRNLPDKSNVRARFHAGDALCNLEFFDGSLEILNFLASSHELHLITALEPELASKRAENLKCVNYTSMQCVGHLQKEQIIIDRIMPDVMIEDRPELIESFFDAGLFVIYPDWHPYTKGMDRFATPFSHWYEIPDLLQKTS